MFSKYRRAKHYRCCLTIRLATANRPRMCSMSQKFTNGSGHGRPCKIFPLSLITVPNLFAVSHAVSAHVGSPEKKFGTLGPRPLVMEAWRSSRNTLVFGRCSWHGTSVRTRSAGKWTPHVRLSVEMDMDQSAAYDFQFVIYRSIVTMSLSLTVSEIKRRFQSKTADFSTPVLFRPYALAERFPWNLITAMELQKQVWCPYQ